MAAIDAATGRGNARQNAPSHLAGVIRIDRLAPLRRRGRGALPTVCAYGLMTLEEDRGNEPVS